MKAFFLKITGVFWQMKKGDIMWSLGKPTDIPDHYSINDIAVLTRWFLADYPIYIRGEDCGLFIPGIPKTPWGKYFIKFTMDWFHTLPSRIFHVFVLNIAVAALLFFFVFFLYKKMK